MILPSLLFLVSALTLSKAASDCSTSVTTCLDDPVCNTLLENYSVCTQDSNNTAYGCDIYLNNTQTNPGYRASCNYMCFTQVAATASNANFTNYGNCLLYNVTLEPTFFSSCSQQTYLTHCFNTTMNNLTCAANVNDLVNCYNGNVPPQPGVCGLTDANTPGFDAACGYQCNMTVQNPTPIYVASLECALADLLVFPNCDTQFQNCLSENTGGYVCPNNLNQALVGAQTAAACQGFNSSSWNSSQISACANATFGVINNTANDAYWNTLDNCVISNVTPSPSPNPSSGSNSSNSASSSTSSGSGSFAGNLACFALVLFGAILVF